MGKALVLPKCGPHYLAVEWPGDEGGRSPVSGTKFPHSVHAVTTLKTGGYSTGDYSQFNLASHVGDDSQVVIENRKKLQEDLSLPAEPVWLDQVHSNKVHRITAENRENRIITSADASTTNIVNTVCAVLTADCLPVFICNEAATEVAVAHAGWRGLHQGIITNTIKAMSSKPEDLLVSLGPAIGPKVFEVGEDVYAAFVEKDALNSAAFIDARKVDKKVGKHQHYLCDIYQLARNELLMLGIDKVSGGEFCTYSDMAKFYSFRRLPVTGRMASLIWLQ